MDLKTLKTFQMIVTYGSFIRAAEEMNYAQSTVTMQIQKLESDLGVQLIERGKKIQLTEVGRLFHERSLHIVKDLEQLQNTMSDMQLGEAGRSPLDTMEIGSMAALKYYVQSGLGIALVPEVSLNPAPAGTLIRTLNGNATDMPCGILCKSSEYPLGLASTKLYQFLKQELTWLAAV
ncbi:MULTISPECIES: LysR family transcriptional regulator [unclassified Paenibacillus]|uniref:LysR family transcriptional regulator n=1 Tax=unclassified Paenibacillus TaxID=185978 RepID=UPI00362C648B